jgi:hypothetical protein
MRSENTKTRNAIGLIMLLAISMLAALPEVSLGQTKVRISFETTGPLVNVEISQGRVDPLDTSTQIHSQRVDEAGGYSVTLKSTTSNTDILSVVANSSGSGRGRVIMDLDIDVFDGHKFQINLLNAGPNDKCVAKAPNQEEVEVTQESPTALVTIQ